MIDQMFDGKFPSNSTIDLASECEDIYSREELIKTFYTKSTDERLFSIVTGTNFYNIRLIKYNKDNKLDDDYHFTYDIVETNEELDRKFK